MKLGYCASRTDFDGVISALILGSNYVAEQVRHDKEELIGGQQRRKRTSIRVHCGCACHDLVDGYRPGEVRL